MAYDIHHKHSIGLSLDGREVSERLKSLATWAIFASTLAITIMPGPNRAATEAWRSIGFLQAEDVAAPSKVAGPDDFRPPLQGKLVITSGMGDRTIFNRKDFHEGTDWKASAGEPVVAMANGEVTGVEEFSGLGQSQIHIQHGPYACSYIHVNPIVEEGDRVAQGDTIATVALTTHAAIAAQLATADHLDARCFDGEQWIDLGKLFEGQGEEPETEPVERSPLAAEEETPSEPEVVEQPIPQADDAPVLGGEIQGQLADSEIRELLGEEL